MFNGLPLHFDEQSLHRNGDVGHHKQREGEEGQYFTEGRTADLFPFANTGDNTDREQQQVCGQDRTDQAAQDRSDEGGITDNGIYQGRQICGHTQQCDQKGRRDGHEHIKGGKVSDALLEQRTAVVLHDLQEALGPAQTLPPSNFKAGGLLIVQHGGVAIADLFALQNIVYGELDIFRKQEMLPAGLPVQDIPVDQKAGPGNGAAGAQKGAGVVQICCFPQEPEGIAGREPVGAVILRIAVAGKDPVPGAEALVHFCDIMFVKKVVRVKYEETVIILGPTQIGNMGIQLIQCITFSDQPLVEALEDRRAVFGGDPSGPVSAVIRYHIDIYQLGGIVAGFDALQQIADNFFFVSCRDHNGIPVGLTCRPVFLGRYDKCVQDIKKLIGIAQCKQDTDAGVEGHDPIHKSPPPFYNFIFADDMYSA